jgi:hypothetical protein
MILARRQRPRRNLHAPIGSAQPPRHNTQNIEREVRRMADEEQKLLLTDRDKLHVADRDRRRVRGATSISAISPKMA